MVNFRDPAVEAADGFILLKFWHVVDGIFIWEFITTLDFEWSIIRGRRRCRWTIWVYSLSRVAALAAVVANLVLLNLNTPVDCQLSAILEMLPAYMALAAASFLLVLRIVAIWRGNMVAVVIAAIVWAINSAFLIQGVSRLRYASEAPGAPCEPVNIQATKVTMIVAFVTDILLLVIMLVGLFRLDCHRHGTLATGRFLWNQGVIWLLLATVAGVLPTVFVCLNLNESLSVIFHIPWLITMAIAATRMYRGLDDFLSSDINCSSHGTPHNGGRRMSVSGTWAPAVPIPLDGTGVDVRSTHDHSLMSQAIRHSLGSDSDRKLHDQPHELA
ncbi:hypothetical protein DFH94DRAFT_20755 [Russula ochroleuca]|uniref:Transmembrane protein n=1 Tax=Russula ochroleuca TaxID=152965 RepID=A0A9P5N6A6_9AGAM|nr:hypothetical protein DFH94DRAFT_20755 [Russula ochroleuca]